jgi:hypothetical protein
MSRSRFGAWTRRRLSIALPGALAAWSLADPRATRGKKRKKKRCPRIDRCPQRGCCECLNNPSSSALCVLVDATDEADIIDACEAACPAGTQESVFNVVDGAANFCGPDNLCTRVVCPVAI